MAPGFIDIHSHSDLSVRDFPEMENILRQGVTTQIVGNCGINLGILEGSLGRFIEEIEKTGIGTNLVFLAGHGAIRTKVMGQESRAPTKKELEEMKSILESTIDEGAKGLSTGLEYIPGIFSSTEEIVELAKVTAKRGGVYSTHLRSEGDELESAVREAIEIGRLADIPVQIAHLKIEKKRNWGKAEEILQLIDSARDDGIDINCDVYPYTAYMTRLNIAIQPFDISDYKDYRDALDRLRNIPMDWELIYITRCNIGGGIEGCSMLDLAKNKGVSPEELVLELLKSGEPIRVISFQMDEEDVKKIIAYRYSFIGSDGISSRKRNEVDRTHPRSFGTFPRVLGRYVREIKLLSLEEAISKMTYLPAKKMNIIDRGIIKEGAYADITIFDPDRIIDKATYDDPFQYPEGIEYVIVNGEIVIDKGSFIDKRAGIVIR